MNFLMFSEDGIDTFKNYLLSEAFTPKKVSFDISNNNNGYAGVFEIKGIKYAAVLLKRKNRLEVAFSNIENMDALVNANPGQNLATKQNVPFSVMNSVFYVIIELLKKRTEKEVYFTGFNEALDKLYTKMVTSKSFTKSINKAGYKYSGKYQDEFIFLKTINNTKGTK